MFINYKMLIKQKVSTVNSDQTKYEIVKNANKRVNLQVQSPKLVNCFMANVAVNCLAEYLFISIIISISFLKCFGFCFKMYFTT